MTAELPRRAIETDLSLHDALSRGLDNPLAAEVYRVNRDRIAVIQNTRPFLPDRIVPAMREHLVIIGALERRDAEAAVAAIAEHYRITLRWWGSSSERQGDGATRADAAARRGRRLQRAGGRRGASAGRPYRARLVRCRWRRR